MVNLKKKISIPGDDTGKTVMTSGELPEMVTDLFADALVQFIQACEAEDREVKAKTA